MKIAIMFPGYGSQYVGMGKELYDDFRIMQEYFEEAANCLDINFVKLCFASSDLELSKMSHAYPAIFLVSSSIYQILKEEGIVPDIVAGYNVGEFSAMHAAGGISFVDGLYLINKYLAFYEEFLSSEDISLIRISGIPSDTLKQICEQYSTNETFAYVSIHSSPEDHVVAGHTSVVDQIIDALKSYEKTKVETVGIEVGLHSPLMRPVFDSLKLYLEKIDFKDTEIPVLSSTELHPAKSGQSLRAAVLDYITTPILWDEVYDYLNEYDLILEVGPGTKLADVAKKHYPNKIILSVNTKADIQKLKEILKADKGKENNKTSEK